MGRFLVLRFGRIASPCGRVVPWSLLVGQKPDRKWSTSLPSRPQPVCTSAITHRVYSGTVLVLMLITVVYVDDATYTDIRVHRDIMEYARVQRIPSTFIRFSRGKEATAILQTSGRHTCHTQPAWRQLLKQCGRKKKLFSNENPKLLGFIQSSKPPLGSRSEMIH